MLLSNWSSQSQLFYWRFAIPVLAPMPLKRFQTWRYFTTIAVLAIAYFLTAKLAISVIGLNQAATPVWPPAGIALAFLVLQGPKVWPGVVLGDWLLVQSFGGSWLDAGISAVGSLLEVLCAVWLLRRLRFRPTMDHLRDVWSFITVAVMLSPLINATLSVAYIALSGAPQGGQIWANWWNFWIGDSVGILVISPLLLTWQRWSALLQQRRSQLEGIVGLLLLLGLSWTVFASKNQAAIADYPLEYLPFPLVVWAALRFGQPGAVLAGLVVSSVAILGAWQGGGPFLAKATSIDQAVLFLQAFMGVMTTMALVVAAAVTERQQTADLLRNSEASLANAQRIAQLGNWDLDSSQQQLRWSDELYRILGFTPKAFPPDQKVFAQAVHPDDRDRVQQAFAQALIDRKSYCIDYRLQLPDGSERFVCEQLAFHSNGVTGTVQDITERKQAQESTHLLSETASRIRRSLHLEQILNTTVTEVREILKADRVYIAHLIDDVQGCVVAESVAPGVSSVLAMQAGKQADPQGIKELRSLYASGLSRVADEITPTNTSPRLAEFYQHAQIKATLSVPIHLGEELWVLVANQCAQPRHWQASEVELLEQLATQVAIAIQQGQLYQQVQALNANLEVQVIERTSELQQKMEELQSLNQFKDIFLHAFTHDLRTSIMGMSLILKNLQKQDGTSIAVSRSILERMTYSNERQLNLINSLLEDQGNQAQQLNLDYDVVRLSDVAEQVLTELAPVISQNQTTLLNLIPNDLPCLHADPEQLRQVFKQLITNSLKHNPPGLNLTLKASLEANVLRCSIEDDGIGLKSSVCDRLFKLYVRGLDNPHLTGIGLGLYLCRQIISAHQGQIGVTSTPGAGTTFWFTLPLTQTKIKEAYVQSSLTTSA